MAPPQSRPGAHSAHVPGEDDRTDGGATTARATPAPATPTLTIGGGPVHLVADERQARRLIMDATHASPQEAPLAGVYSINLDHVRSTSRPAVGRFRPRRSRCAG